MVVATKFGTWVEKNHDGKWLMISELSLDSRKIYGIIGWYNMVPACKPPGRCGKKSHHLSRSVSEGTAMGFPRLC